MKWTIYQSIKDGKSLLTGKEIKFENCTFATDANSPYIYVFQENKIIFELTDPKIKIHWKGLDVSGLVKEIYKGTDVYRLNRFWAICSVKNEEEDKK